MFIASHNKNSFINFERKGLNQQKSQILLGSKISPNAWQKCIKTENIWKRRGNKVLPALDDKNLAKDWGENDKKTWLEALTDRIREKEFWKFLK